MRVATAITLDIERGALKPSQRIFVTRLATPHRVDPTSVHQALWMLQRSGKPSLLGSPRVAATGRSPFASVVLRVQGGDALEVRSAGLIDKWVSGLHTQT
ncbi:hypothetical protein N4G70_35650 [Streptomyces sp. ASQP_92]|uniref:hypothetical protein n=1 Tax=Streptomyces sp. ASQP_92 TaxID=2979116 RepID=UPI0021C1135F|nr:hypothetical protein [Streptomyces sp. ASQP_92]MCT9094143.1 hypothetical protein [Streptomyces sp. ASQP_92]